MHKATSNSLGTGVYYARQDYRGLGYRALIVSIDAVVAMIFFTALAVVFEKTGREIGQTYFRIVLVVLWVYFALLRAIRFPTLGYWLTRSQLVTLRGETPSILRATFRWLLACFAPVNAAASLFWAGIDDERQSLPDRFAGTLLIRKGAIPLGTGEIHFARYFVFGLAIIYRTVHRPNRLPAEVALHSS